MIEIILAFYENKYPKNKPWETQISLNRKRKSGRQVQQKNKIIYSKFSHDMMLKNERINIVKVQTSTWHSGKAYTHYGRGPEIEFVRASLLLSYFPIKAKEGRT